MTRLRSRELLLSMIFILSAAVAVAGCGKPEQPAGKKEAPAGETAEKEEAPAPSREPITEERTYFNFENDLNGWEIPMWAQGKIDHVATDIMVSTDTASKGASSMKVQADFPGNMWSASLVEIQMYLNLSAYRVISADMYVPETAPMGLKAKIILTVGDTWKFVEMANSVPLIPGEWITVSANIEPGSYAWKRVVPDDSFAKDVRKVAIRVVSNKKPKYTGPIYIDNIRVGR